MIPDKELIEQCSETAYAVLATKEGCTLQELQSLCNLDSTDLCFALLHLLKEKRIESAFDDGKVTYRVIYQ